MKPHLKSQDNYFAVLDVGSNSVRFVVFSSITRTPDIVFNEKVLCGLGKDVGTTGAMDQESMDEAIIAMRRFSALSIQMQVRNIYAFATAAVRDASNGSAFIEQIKISTGFDVDVISGQEEARLAALGVISGNPHACGIVGDLGGGSLELARVCNGKVYECISLPIGSLRLKHQTAGNYDVFTAIVKDALKSVSWLTKYQGETLYIVGGAWRNIARLLLIKNDEPISVIHGYSVTSASMKSFVNSLTKGNIKEYPNKKIIPAKRRDILPEAAYVLKKIISMSKIETVNVSSFGVREGINFDRLDNKKKILDPLLNQSLSVAKERCRFPEHGSILYHWIKPIFPTQAEDHAQLDRLNRAVCILSDIAWRAHPDYKAERAVELALHGRWLDVSHHDRAYMGVALNQAYGGRFDAPYIKDVLGLLSSRNKSLAMALGAALRLAQRLSGGTLNVLAISKLRLDKAKIILVIDTKYRDLYGSIVTRRLKVLSALLELDYEVIFEDKSNRL